MRSEKIGYRAIVNYRASREKNTRMKPNLPRPYMPLQNNGRQTKGKMQRLWRLGQGGSHCSAPGKEVRKIVATLS